MRPAAQKLRPALPQILLLGAGLLAYANALSGPFVYDDGIAILGNPALRSLWPPWGALFSERFTPLAGRPVATFSFALTWAAAGPDVRAHHAVSLVLHLLSGLALFGLVRRGLALERGEPPERATGIALAAALLWLVHPLNSEPVDYLTQRTELLAGLFVLLTAYAALRSLEPDRRPRFAALSVACCALAMGSKENAAVAPLLVVLLHGCLAGRGALREQRALYAGLAATWLLLAALVATGPRSDTVGFSLGVSPYSYLLNQCDVIVDYLRKSVWPWPLAFDYGVPRPLGAADVWPQALLLGALAAGTLAVLRVRPALGLLGLWFFATLAPSSSVVPIVTEVGAERRMYLPLASLCTGAALLGWLALRRAPRGAAAALAAAAVCALLLATRARNLDYADPIRLWQSAARARPDNPRAHVNLAVLQLSAGRAAPAEQALRRALELAPDDVLAHYNLALALAARGAHEEARRSFETALGLAERGGHEGLAARIRAALRR